MQRLMIVAALSGLLSGCGNNTPEGRAQTYCNSNDMAFVMSQNFVKRQLKAPSTAKFPHEAAVTKTGDCSFKVVAYVDAQNSFGAMIRSSYTADMEYEPASNKWYGSNVVVLE